MREIALFLLLSVSIYSSGQESRLLVFDLITKETDTLNIPEFDTGITSEETNYNTGMFNNNYNDLSLLFPSENINNRTNFTFKRQASKDYDVNGFPIRTSVKLFKWENDSIKSRCSGSMISRRHVLTACHCVAALDKNSLLYDSLFVCPVLDNGVYNNNFDCSWVKKVFFFENWDLRTDFSVLELEKPVGKNTGWISIGFDANDSSLLDGIFYKFSYPATTIPLLDTNAYNGDTLYYCYGVADIVTDHSFGVTNAIGIPGESGSSLIKIENQKKYTSYGVFSSSTNFNHSRLTNWKYYALKSIISNDIELNIQDIQKKAFVSIYPNPVEDKLKIIPLDKNGITNIFLFNINGTKIIDKNKISDETQFDLSGFPAGTYILVIFINKKKIVKKIIKSG